jgi:hypothetical protein
MTMIMMCVGCAVLAAWLAVPVPADRSIRSRLSTATRNSVAEDAGGGRGLRRRLWIDLVIMIIVLLVITAAGYLASARGAVVSCVILLIALTAIRLGWQYRRRRSALRSRAEIAQACAVLASYLRVGQVPSAALAIAAADCEVLRETIRLIPSAAMWCRSGDSRHAARDMLVCWSLRERGRFPSRLVLRCHRHLIRSQRALLLIKHSPKS